MKTIVTKGEYAALKKREPSCVSNWIAEGKITTAALIGEGRRARIWVEQADADLARALDPSQQLAQQHPILPAAAAPDQPTSAAADNVIRLRSPGAAAAEELDEDIRRKRKADADRAEQEAFAAARRNAIEDGRWIEAAEAMRLWTGELAKLVSETETFLCTTLARAVADQYGLDWKALSVEFRNHFRAHRAGAANEAQSEAEMLQAAE